MQELLPLISLSGRPSYLKGVQLDHFQRHIKLHSDQLSSVEEMKITGFSFCWPCDSQQRLRQLNIVGNAHGMKKKKKKKESGKRI